LTRAPAHSFPDPPLDRSARQSFRGGIRHGGARTS
jgi:hypothetical protein